VKIKFPNCRAKTFSCGSDVRDMKIAYTILMRQQLAHVPLEDGNGDWRTTLELSSENNLKE
jgi:hypothetical protein